MPRTRASIPDGDSSRRSPIATWPAKTVPVTTVPTPARVKLRSTARRKRPATGRGGRSAAAASSRASSSAIPAPVTDDTGRISAFARPVPASRTPICCLDLRQPLGGNEIDLGERNDAVLQAEEIEDLQMLAGLRHRPVVGGDDQQDEIDADGAREHVVHETLMAGHVDEAQGLRTVDGSIGEADIDGDAARLLFGQTVGIDPRERPNQRRLAVIDVAGRADDHGGASTANRLCAAARSSGVMTVSTRRRNPAASSFPRPAASVSQRKACA